ncbi:MAG: ABC transporter ATP-binding protein [Clostridia bacterium]
MKRYFKYIKPYWIFFVLSPLLMVVEVYADVLMPALAADVIDIGVASGEASTLGILALKMFGVFVMAILSGTGAAYAATKASVEFAHDLREDIFTKIQSFSFQNIDKFSTGSLVTRLTNDITQLQQLVVIALRMAFRAPGLLVGAMIMAFTINAKLAIIFVVIVPILAIIIALVLYFAYKKFALLQIKVDALNTTVQEILTNIRIVKALTREKYEADRFDDVNDDLKTTGLQAFRITILQTPAMTILVNAGTIAILWFGATAFNNGEIAIGSISALITYLAQILGSVGMLANVFMQASRAIVSGKRVSEILDEEVDISDDNAKKLDKTVNSGDVVFENVNFKYYKNNKELVLSNINIHIKSGETVGIIGSTGCGKTSFVHLIPRLYDADAGNVYVDGTNVKDYSLKNLRDGVAMVLQNNLLFTGTIKENLMWGDQNATDEDITNVADWAAASDFIEATEDGYETFIDQGGLNFSGGQKQRLCIARALIKKTKVLILDDSTSAVDTATESRIRSHLYSDLGDVTKIIIAQRISSVINADKIIVMNDGHITNMGTHDELMESSEIYNEIYNSQMESGGSDNV